MSSERIKKYIILFLVFSSFIFLTYIIIRDFVDKNNMHKLEENAYQLFDYISIDNRDIIINNSMIDISLDSNIKLPQKGIIKINNHKIYAILFSNNYCSYKKYEEGVLTSKKVKTYDECIKLSNICLVDQNYCQ